MPFQAEKKCSVSLFFSPKALHLWEVFQHLQIPYDYSLLMSVLLYFFAVEKELEVHTLIWSRLEEKVQCHAFSPRDIFSLQEKKSLTTCF